jgi:hypothetical protein
MRLLESHKDLYSDVRLQSGSGPAETKLTLQDAIKASLLKIRQKRL